MTTIAISAPTRTRAAEGRIAGERGGVRYLVGAICVFLIALMLAPLVFSLLASLKPSAEAAAVPPTYLPSALSIENYLKVFEWQQGLGSYLLNSLGTAALAIVMCLVLSVTAGYGLARFLAQPAIGVERFRSGTDRDFCKPCHIADGRGRGPLAIRSDP